MKWINSKSLVGLALVVCVATPLLLGGKQGHSNPAKKDAGGRINENLNLLHTSGWIRRHTNINLGTH